MNSVKILIYVSIVKQCALMYMQSGAVDRNNVKKHISRKDRTHNRNDKQRVLPGQDALLYFVCPERRYKKGQEQGYIVQVKI